jgi:hypothetical protein
MKEYSIEYSMFVHPAQNQTATFYFTLEATSDTTAKLVAQNLFPDWRVTSITTLEPNNVRKEVWSMYE